MASITLKEVREIANLARLELTDEETGRMQRDLGSILGYVEKLRLLDTTGVEPMTHAVPMDCPLREDEARGSFTGAEALSGAPRRAEDFFEVPRIIDVQAAESEHEP